MKLILTDYIASLKEDGELDALLMELLRALDVEVVFGPKKGERQYGVDIYAVGTDWEDGIRKLFLVTVKQGNFDRKNWHGTPQSIQPSLYEMATTFVRNNIAPEHKGLPVKIVVAHNGANDPAVQQDWTAFVEQFPQLQFVLWQLETIVRLVEEHLLDENLFSDKAKRVLRKIIIHLADPSYDLADVAFIIDEIIAQIDLGGAGRRKNLNNLRKINLLLNIILSYCEFENDLRLALKATEMTVLRMWDLFRNYLDNFDEGYWTEFARTLHLKRDVGLKYLKKVSDACDVRDGFSKYCRDTVTYSFTVYENLGFLAIPGLEFIQMAESYISEEREVAARLEEQAAYFADAIVGIYNNNPICFSPRADNQINEINFVFLLLYRLGRIGDIRALLYQYNEQLALGALYAKIAPHFHNNHDNIYELDIQYEKRKEFNYESSCLLAVLVEWCVVIGDKGMYEAYTQLKTMIFSKTDLILWFPDEATEGLLYREYATKKTGYSLSGIELVGYEEFAQLTLTEYVHNCAEVSFSFMNQRVWIIGLIASRHFGTYVFPHYWRQLIKNHSAFVTETIPA